MTPDPEVRPQPIDHATEARSDPDPPPLEPASPDAAPMDEPGPIDEPAQIDEPAPMSEAPTAPAADSGPEPDDSQLPHLAVPADSSLSTAEAAVTEPPPSQSGHADHVISLLQERVAGLEVEMVRRSTQSEAAERRADELALVARRQTEMADELHSENRRLREGELQQALAPIVRGLARLSDDLDRMRVTDPDSADLRYLGTQIKDVLDDIGVAFVQPEFAEPFDPRVHQAAGSTVTTDEGLDKTVAEVRRGGLRRDDGRLLRPAEVVVHRYQAPAGAVSASVSTETDDDAADPADDLVLRAGGPVTPMVPEPAAAPPSVNPSISDTTISDSSREEPS